MKSILILAGIIVVMAGAAFVVTKMVLKPALAPKTVQAGDESGENANSGESKGEGKDKAKDEVYLISNLLVNPKGTSGTRYLSASLGLQVKTATVVEKLKARDLQVRDLLIQILSTRTVEQLTDPAARESMRREILQRLNQMVGGEQLSAVYFVDYVLQ